MNGTRRLITLALICFTLYGSVCFAQAESPHFIRQSQKVIDPDLVLEPFDQGRATTRVIVNLSPIVSWGKHSNFRNFNYRQSLQLKVKEAQARVIDRLNSRKVRITNKFTYVFAFSAEVTMEGLKKLTEMDEVASINRDRILKPHLQQGINLINAADVRTTYDGSGIAIAICDTGIDYNHPKLGGGGFPNPKVIGGYDTGQNDDDPMDGNGHGTACAGIAAGDLGFEGDYIGGVAFNAKLYALKITSNTTGGSAYESDMIEAWEWCVTHQYDDPQNPIMIISTSFGGGYHTSTCDTESPAMTQAATNAVAAGITLFVSSGNDGFCDGTGWPACISTVNGVGAVYDGDIGSRNGLCIDSNSCIGYFDWDCWDSWACDDPSTSSDLVTCYSNSADFLSLLAPSNNAYTTDISGSGGYSSGDYMATFGGTSAACPYAAGAAALLQSAAQSISGSFLSSSEVKSLLTGTGDLVTDSKIDITKPRINLGAAIAKLEKVDLVVLGIEADPLEPEPGEEVDILITVKNEGMVDAGPFRVDWYADLSTPPAPGEPGDRWEEISSLAAGDTYMVHTSYIYSGSGTYAMAAQVDTEQLVDEWREDNNVLWPASLLVGVCECDLNKDGSCNGLDWLLFYPDWGRFDCAGSWDPCECDLNNDGSCNGLDWLIFYPDWGRTDCPLTPPLFFEDFEDDLADGWVDDGSGVWSVGDGVYKMTGSLVSTARYSHYNEDFDNFTYQVDVRRMQGNELAGQGVIFRGGGSDENFYAFHIGANGKYFIFKRVDGVTIKLIPAWTFTSAIQQGFDKWNTLKVVCQGSTMEFYINSTLVESLIDSEFVTGKVGVRAVDNASMQNIMHFDNARLTLEVDLSGVQPRPALSIPAAVGESEVSQ
jgi:hypothetical protein